VGEYLYNIDRMLIQLKRAGVLKQLSGLIIGGFTECKDTTRPFGKKLEELIQEHIAEYDYPVCYHFPVSHAKANVALKVGMPVSLRVTAQSVTLKEL